MTNEANNFRQLFKRMTGKVSHVRKRGYISALSSIEASKRAGKTTVLKMEIASRKLKMKKLFTVFGERVYRVAPDKAADILNNASMNEILDTIKSHDSEIKEIEDYIASLSNENDGDSESNGGNGGNGKKNRLDLISEADDTRGVVPEIQPEVICDRQVFEEKPPDMSGFAESMKDENKEVRVGTLKQLFKLEGPQAVALLVESLKDKDAEIRRRAASYLGWKMAVSAVPSLIEAAGDKDLSVKLASLEALGELSAQEAVPALIEGLDDRDVEIRKTASKSLTKVTDEFIEFDPQGSLAGRFKSIQRWRNWWKKQTTK